MPHGPQSPALLQVPPPGVSLVSLGPLASFLQAGFGAGWRHQDEGLGDPGLTCRCGWSLDAPAQVGDRRTQGPVPPTWPVRMGSRRSGRLPAGFPKGASRFCLFSNMNDFPTLKRGRFHPVVVISGFAYPGW